MKTAQRKRFEQIVLAFVIATEGRVPVRISLADLLALINLAAPGVDEAEVRAAIDWCLREGRRAAARYQRAMYPQRRRKPRLRIVPMSKSEEISG